jgi:GNAT superfamily N-acetyltransferase
MGNGGPLPRESLDRLIPGLKNHPTTLIFLAYKNQQAVGLATCFRGFSTFAARPLINIHDLVVLPNHRGMGIGRRLLAAIEQKARELDCCKVTLEVQENNTKARRAYGHAGFSQGLYSPTTGGSLYYWKTL